MHAGMAGLRPNQKLKLIAYAITLRPLGQDAQAARAKDAQAARAKDAQAARAKDAQAARAGGGSSHDRSTFVHTVETGADAQLLTL